MVKKDSYSSAGSGSAPQKDSSNRGHDTDPPVRERESCYVHGTSRHSPRIHPEHVQLEMSFRRDPGERAEYLVNPADEMRKGVTHTHYVSLSGDSRCRSHCPVGMRTARTSG